MTGPLGVVHVGKFYHPYRGGMETHLRTLCEGLAPITELSVVVANSTRRTEHDMVNGVRVTRVGTMAVAASAPITPGMAREMRRAGADVVHVHLPHPTASLSYLTGRIRGSLVVTYHSDIVRQRMLGALYEPVQQAFLRRASAIICTSPDYRDSSPSLRPHLDRCVVAPFSLDPTSLLRPDPAEVEAIRQKFGDRLVLGVGRLVSYKGFTHLVRAMQRVDAHLLLIGEGPLRKDLEEQTRADGVAGKVTFLGHVPETAPYFHAATVFALSSIERSEAFGLVQLEAMWCGVPVVNTRLASGVPYVSRHGETGLTVPPRDPEALGAALRTLLDDASLRDRLGAAARARAENTFNVKAMIDGTMEVYRRVTSSTGA